MHVEQRWADIRRYGLILVIAVLYTVFVVTAIDAVLTKPEYGDYCSNDRRPHPGPVGMSCPGITVPDTAVNQCDGDIVYEHNESGCPVNYTCSTCRSEYEDARKTYNLYLFLIAAVLGVASIVVGMVLPREQNRLNEWIGSGLIFGGVLTVFTGTVQSFGSIGKLYRPIIIFFELVLVIYLAYRFYGSE